MELVLIHQKDKNFDHATFPDAISQGGAIYVAQKLGEGAIYVAQKSGEGAIVVALKPWEGAIFDAYIGATKIEFHQKLLNS